MGWVALFVGTNLMGGITSQPSSQFSISSFRRSRYVGNYHVSPSPLTGSPVVSCPHVRLLRVGVPRTAHAVLWKLTILHRLDDGVRQSKDIHSLQCMVACATVPMRPNRRPCTTARLGLWRLLFGNDHRGIDPIVLRSTLRTPGRQACDLLDNPRTPSSI